MEFPFASMFILKLVLLSLLSTTKTFSTPTNNNALVSYICTKTNNPKQCLDILSLDNTTDHPASSLHDLGSVSLDLAIIQAKLSANEFNKVLVQKKDLPTKVTEKYKGCGDNYVMAMIKLGEAKIAWIIKKYGFARKSIEAAYQVPISCEKELVGIPPAQLISAATVNEVSHITFEIALAIVKKLDTTATQ